MIKKLFGNHHILLWMIFLLALLVRGYGLAIQPPTDDEVGAASAATNYMSNGLFGQVMWYHPPLRNIVVFLSSILFGGYTAWGLRFGSLILGSLSVLVLGYLAYSLFRDRLVAGLSAFFLTIDPLHISLSREAFQETTTAFFIIAGTLAAYHGIKRDSVWFCYLSGALFGMATASKWHGIFPLAASAGVYLAAPWVLKGNKGECGLALRALTAATAFLVIPLVVYTAVYIPWLSRGYSLREFGDLQLWLLKHQYFYKSTPYTEDFLSHRAYQWFLWPVAWVDFVYHSGKSYLNIAMGNYLVWCLTLPSLYYACKRWLHEKNFELGFVILLFLISYLPLILTTRSIWVFAAPAVIPFAFILIGLAISYLLEKKKIPRFALALYLAAAVSISAILYPLATFRALDYAWAKPLADMYSPHAGKPH